MIKCIAMGSPLVLAAGMLAGCHSDQPSMSKEAGDAAAGHQMERTIAVAPAPAETDRSASPHPGIAGPHAGDLQIAEPWRFADVSHVTRAASWEARLSQLHRADQEWLRQRDSHYAGALEFDSPEEQQRMIEQGFPMPEEWLAAKRMPDSELEALAKSGNQKAQMFFIDRVSDALVPILAPGDGLDTSSAQDMALLTRASAANTMALRLMRSTKSPFAAYLDGRINTAMTQYTPPESMASAILFAGDLGDTRAAAIRERYFQANPDMDAALISQIHAGRKRLVLGQGQTASR